VTTCACADIIIFYNFASILFVGLCFYILWLICWWQRTRTFRHPSANRGSMGFIHVFMPCFSFSTEHHRHCWAVSHQQHLIVYVCVHILKRSIEMQTLTSRKCWLSICLLIIIYLVTCLNSSVDNANSKQLPLYKHKNYILGAY
jgi:hypothetical protein